MCMCIYICTYRYTETERVRAYLISVVRWHLLSNDSTGNMGAGG